MNMKKRIGILRVSELILRIYITEFFTGKRRFVNKNLRLFSVRRIETDFHLAFNDYDLVFEGDDLPLIPEGCYPLFLDMVQVGKTGKRWKLIEAPIQDSYR